MPDSTQPPGQISTDTLFPQCFQCGSDWMVTVVASSSIRPESSDDVTTCNSCFSYFFRVCQGCNVNLLRDAGGVANFRASGHTYCNDCSDGYYGCNRCGLSYQPVNEGYEENLPEGIRDEFCARCAQILFTACSDCSEFRRNSVMTEVRLSNTRGRIARVCQSCSEIGTYAECHWCNTAYVASDSGVGYPTGFSNQPDDGYNSHTGNVCAYCATHYAQRCVCCSEYGNENRMRYSDASNGYICGSCMDGFEYCSCGDVYDPDNSGPCCEPPADSFGCDCSSCRRRSSYSNRLINYYSYKPDPVFFGDGPVYLGMELEISVHGDREAAASVATEAFKSLVYLKEDGSIGGGGGFELVTHPFSYEWGMNNIPWASFADLASHGARKHETCGMHVHVSRSGFSGACHEYRWLKFWHRNSLDMQKMARRSSDEWAAFKPSSRQNAKAIATKKGSDDRYVAINPQNTHTYEVRVFASTLDVNEIKSSLGLVDATVEYTRTLRSKDVIKADGWSFASFRDWLAYKPKYAPLVADIEAKMTPAPTATKESN